MKPRSSSGSHSHSGSFPKLARKIARLESTFWARLSEHDVLADLKNLGAKTANDDELGAK